METDKEVSIQIKVTKQTAKQLHKRAKQRGLIFSKYIKRILIDSLQKDNG